MSRMKTLAPRPAATLAALAPTTPPPKIVTFAGATPGTPPSKIRRPWNGRSRNSAPSWMLMLPATSPIAREFLDPGGRHGDAVLVRFDFLRHADDHDSPREPVCSSRPL